MTTPPPPPSPGRARAGAVAAAAGFALLAAFAPPPAVPPGAALLLWVLLRATGTPLPALGLTGGARSALAAAGTGLAAVLAGAVPVLGAALALGAWTPAAPPAAAWGAAALALVAVVLPEEAVFRGYVQYALGTRRRGLGAVAAQAALFAPAAALVQGDPGALATGFAFGFLLGYLRLRSGRLWTALGVRAGLLLAGVWAAGLSPGWAAALSAAAGLAALAAVRPAAPARSAAAGDPPPRRALAQRGVLYDVGSSYLPGQHSRERWRPDVVAGEMRVIAQDLHCNAVTVFGHDLGRLEEAARSALDHGLFVWVQPRLVDGTQDEITERLGRAAAFCERLRADHPDRVGLNVGCELSVFAQGIVPGDTFAVRTARLAWLFPLSPLFDRRLDRLLRRLARTARAGFAGPLTYGSGGWENVDWSPFDLVGVDHYLDGRGLRAYRDGLRALHGWGRPVLVTEFGCCAYEGAREAGGSGSDILDWSDPDDRRVRPGYPRSEKVQADTLDELLDVFETEEVHGAFVCMFIEGDCRYSEDPERDQDKASFGIVRPPSLESGLSPDDGHWEPKEAFHLLARRFAAAPEPGPGTGPRHG
ncbi:CPBP family glutamic-type intramembrane protease [Nocardiopsis sp. NPDC006139]|uniref:CPBP family glutamic-type intramembrane protease n=1 Tax=Nocardiopsis sp. NPDC006139 TaxID=3154578 RepID=UPI0033B8ED6E